MTCSPGASFLWSGQWSTSALSHGREIERSGSAPSRSCWRPGPWPPSSAPRRRLVRHGVLAGLVVGLLLDGHGAEADLITASSS